MTSEPGCLGRAVDAGIYALPGVELQMSPSEAARAAWGGTGTHILSYTTANAGAANSESNAI